MGAISTAVFNSSSLRGSLNMNIYSLSSSSNFAVKLNCREECRRSMMSSAQGQAYRRVLCCSDVGRAGGPMASAPPGSEGSAPENGVPAQPHSSSPSPPSAIDFLTLCQLLKTTKRKGWLNQGIKNAESIADHMYRMAVMALIVGDLPGINRDRCVKMAVVHDIAEAIVGDITPSDGIPKEEKSRREREALDEMCHVLGGGPRAAEIRELWNEYENNSSPEANLVKDFDKVELILQALEYENEHGKVWEEFFESTKGKIQTDIGKQWAAEIHARRNERLGHACK